METERQRLRSARRDEKRFSSGVVGTPRSLSPDGDRAQVLTAAERRAKRAAELGLIHASGNADPTHASPNRDSKSLPHGASWYFASPRKYKETVIFVPFFGGKKLQLQRHIQFVNAMGFDAVAFEFSSGEPWKLTSPPFSTRVNKIGLKHRWADEFEDILNTVLGPKIVYAFSNPCSAAIEALVRSPQRFGKTQNCRDVRAMICDSGPFVHLLDCSWRLMKYDRHVFFPIRFPVAAASALLWAPDHEASLHADLKELPAKFPILSVRGWKDKLVPVRAIEDAFAGHDQLQLEVLGLPEGGHLEGLKGFPEEYKPRVERFLERYATAATSEASPV